MWTAREDRRSKDHMTNDPNDPVLPLGKSSVIVEITVRPDLADRVEWEQPLN
jgi:hypothetical protein